jgi:hypothetical protein
MNHARRHEPLEMPMRRTALAAVAAASLALAVAAAPAAQANVPVDRTTHGRTIAAIRGAKGTGLATSTTDISNHGGPVIAGTVNAYVIWYGSWDLAPGTVKSYGSALLTNELKSIGGTPYFTINTSYSSFNGAVTGAVTLAGSTTDAYSKGTRLSDSGVQAVVSRAISSGRLPSDTNGVYFVLTSRDVSESSGFLTRYCGWHAHGTIGGRDIKYSFVGDPSSRLSSCSAQSVGPNGAKYAGADAMASVIAHELEEAVTDPDLNAWYDSSGAENADKCAWTFGKTPTGGTSNVTWGGTPYLIQQNWSATTQSCLMAAA